jgi:cbb3-type cytochrome oxidase subunit 1
MGLVRLVACLAVVVGVAGYVIGLRRSRRNDEVERGLVLWMVLAWAGVMALVVDQAV